VSNDAITVDVLIVGAGPAGAASALALQIAGCQRMMIVGRRARRAVPAGDAASPDVGPLLRRLGLADGLEERGHIPHYGTLSIWGRAVPVADDFLRRGLGHGWHLDRRSFDGWLLKTAAHRGALVLDDAVVSSLSRSTGGRWIARVESKDEALRVDAAAVVLASGRAVRGALRLEALHRVDRLVALVTTFADASPSCFDGYAAIEAVEHGWWYASRLPRGGAVVMFMTDPDVARAHRLLEPGQFVTAWLRSTLVSRFLRPPSAHACVVAVHSAATQYLERAHGAGWVAVGDALMALDPLTSSGISGAISDGIEAAAAVVAMIDGDTARADERLCSYASRAKETLRRFACERREIYARERRWRDTPFWQRRGSAAAQRLQPRP
jgi:flavin-dependent dehydrogenase